MRKNPVSESNSAPPKIQRWDQTRSLAVMLALAVVTVATSACNIDGKVHATFSHTKTADFEKSEIITAGNGIADGTTESVIAIHLKNSDNTSVPAYRPTYSVTGAGVTAGQCSESDTNGISACVLKSVQTGVKTVKLTNAKVGLAKDIEFDTAARTGRIFGLISGDNQKLTTPANYKAEVSIGDTTKNIKATTTGGYQVMVSVQGAFVSR